MTDLDIAEDLGTGSDQDTVADLGMAILVLLAGPAQRDVVQDGDIVLDDRGLADYKTCGMVEEDAATDLRRRIDVGLEHRRRAALQIIGKILAALLVEPVRQAVGLNGMKTLEVEQGIDEAHRRRIAIIDGDEVGAKGVADIGIVTKRLV